MASKNKTKRLGLNNWVNPDKPTMEDFNKDNQIIDEKMAILSKTGATNWDSGNFDPRTNVLVQGATTFEANKKTELMRIHSERYVIAGELSVALRAYKEFTFAKYSLINRITGGVVFKETSVAASDSYRYATITAEFENFVDNRNYEIVIYVTSTQPGGASVKFDGVNSDF